MEILKFVTVVYAGLTPNARLKIVLMNIVNHVTQALQECFAMEISALQTLIVYLELA
jgi:hypothetical protein